MKRKKAAARRAVALRAKKKIQDERQRKQDAEYRRIELKQAAAAQAAATRGAIIFQMSANGTALSEISKTIRKPKRYCQEVIAAQTARIEQAMGEAFDPHGQGLNPHQYRHGGWTGLFCDGCDFVGYQHTLVNGDTPCGEEPGPLYSELRIARWPGGGFFARNGVITCAGCCEKLGIPRTDYQGKPWSDEGFEFWQAERRRNRNLTRARDLGRSGLEYWAPEQYAQRR